MSANNIIKTNWLQTSIQCKLSKDKITTGFHDKEKFSLYICFLVILTGSVLKLGENYCPQMFLE